MNNNAPDTENSVGVKRLEDLKMWNNALGCYCMFHMLENTDVEGTLVAVNGKQESFLVKNLKTWLGTYPAVILRGNDIVNIDIHSKSPEKTKIEERVLKYSLSEERRLIGLTLPKNTPQGTKQSERLYLIVQETSVKILINN